MQLRDDTVTQYGNDKDNDYYTIYNNNENNNNNNNYYYYYIQRAVVQHGVNRVFLLSCYFCDVHYYYIIC